MARETRDDWVLGRALNAVFPSFVGPAYARERLDAATEAYKLGQRLDDRDMAQHGADGVSFSALELGDGRTAREYAVKARELGTALRWRFTDRLYATYGVVLALCDGDLELAERLAEEAGEAHFKGPDSSGVYGMMMFSIRREQGRLKELVPVLKLVAARDSAGAWKPGLAAVYAEVDMRQEATQIFDDLAHRGFHDLAHDAAYPVTLSLLTDVCAYLRDQRRAAELKELLLPYRDLVISAPPVMCYGPASRYLGMLALTMGDRRDATEFLERAVEQSESLQSPLWKAHSLYWLARASGDQEFARAALRTAERLGLVAIANKCLRYLQT
jgi:tetratricopeptide (TPR) repeat protein